MTARSLSRERGQSGERPEAGLRLEAAMVESEAGAGGSIRMEAITNLGDTEEVRIQEFSLNTLIFHHKPI